MLTAQLQTVFTQSYTCALGLTVRHLNDIRNCAPAWRNAILRTNSPLSDCDHQKCCEANRRLDWHWCIWLVKSAGAANDMCPVIPSVKCNTEQVPLYARHYKSAVMFASVYRKKDGEILNVLKCQRATPYSPSGPRLLRVWCTHNHCI